MPKSFNPFLWVLVFALFTPCGAKPQPHRRLSLASRGQSLMRPDRLYQAIHGDNDYAVLLRRLHRSIARWSTTPTLWPCQGELSSPFGYRSHPVLGGARFHPGCDICAPEGTPIQATGAGKVIFADWLQGYGLALEIDHGGGLSTFYGHCSKICVKKGEPVLKGRLVANVGCTGMVTGPHCHYEVHLKGKKINPARYMKSHSL